MPRMTNAQLTDENIRLRTECDRLESAYNERRKIAEALLTERDEAVEALHRLKDELLAARLPAPRTPRIVTREPHALPAHFAAAREAAMRMGRCVKVGA